MTYNSNCFFKLKKCTATAALIATTFTTNAEEPLNPAAAMELPDLDVVGTTPLPGTGLPIKKYPGNVQMIDADEIDEQNPVDLSEMLFRNLGSVDINSAQNNPFQNDVNYRGFLASPLVGTAIGISVFIDGVRVNEGFGDTVNWDLIPEMSLSNVTLIPGSNPLFGLNTLGGALSLQTKSGRYFQGTEFELTTGVDARRNIAAEHGGVSGNFDWYLAGNIFKDDGWRDESQSDLDQIFTKVGWENETTDFDLSYTYADTALTGNGFAPESLMALDRKAAYTLRDDTDNNMHLLNLRASHWLNDNLLVGGNAYYRKFERETFNGDAELGCVAEVGGNDFPLFIDGDIEEEDNNRIHNANCDNDAIAALHPDATFMDFETDTATVFNPAIHEAEHEVEGERRKTSTQTDTWGGALQVSHNAEIAGHENTFTIGAAYDKSDTTFSVSQAEAGIFIADNGITRDTRVCNDEGGDPQTCDDSEAGKFGGDFVKDVDIDTQNENWAIYFTDTVDLTDQIALTASARYQHTTVDIRDRTGEEDKLNGSHSFSRLNPAVGVAFNPLDNLTLYGAYNESFRVPTAAELTCADPEDPCNLPNSFVADPPLDPVVGKTIEIGARGALTQIGNIGWNLGLFRTKLEQDLLFTTTQSSGAGFFQNVEETRRQGIELGLNGLYSRFAWYMNYSYIDATFESDERLASVVEPDGVFVQAGDALPAIPKHNVKLGIDVAATDKLSIGANMTYASATFMRGDESNDLPKVDDYAVFNMNARYSPTEHVQLWLKVDNIFDTDYETSGIRNFNSFPHDGTSEIKEERFLSAGAPRSAWVGLKVSF